MPLPKINRRAAIAGAILSTIAVGIPAAQAAKALFVPAGSPTLPPEGCLGAIRAHKAAMRALRRQGRVVDRLEAIPGPDYPKVRYSWLLKGRDDQGQDIRQPLYAYSHEQIDKEVDADISARRSWGPKKGTFPEAEARRAKMHREFTTLTRRKRAFDRRIGLTAAEAAMTVAYEAESRAAVALLFAVPASGAEALAKARYLKREPADWWLGSGNRQLILAASCLSAGRPMI